MQHFEKSRYVWEKSGNKLLRGLQLQVKHWRNDINSGFYTNAGLFGLVIKTTSAQTKSSNSNDLKF